MEDEHEGEVVYNGVGEGLVAASPVRIRVGVWMHAERDTFNRSGEVRRSTGGTEPVYPKTPKWMVCPWARTSRKDKLYQIGAEIWGVV